MLSSVAKKIKAVPDYLYRNLLAPRLYSIRDREILKKNHEIKDKFSGRRCFIIGGGPSVKDLDLKLLKNEFTFVMSEAEKNPQYRQLDPKFHFIMDSNYYTEGGTEHWIARFKEKDREIPESTTVVTALAAKQFIDKHGLFRRHKVYFMGTQGIFSEKLPFNINLDRYVPYPKNSVLACLMAAVWMGFKEIYLLGCEHSFLAQPLGPNKSLGFSHGYDDGTSYTNTSDKTELEKYISKKEIGFTYEMNIVSILQLFKNYRLFYTKARKQSPGLRIFNATPNSFLDVFPMINFDKIKI